MKTAVIETDGNGCRIVVYDGAVIDRVPCANESEAMVKLSKAGWKSDGKIIWHEPVHRRPSFVGVPLCYPTRIVSYIDDMRFGADGEYRIAVSVMSSGVPETFAFCFRALLFEKPGTVLSASTQRSNPVEVHQDCGDPILDLVSSDLVEVEAVGCWFNEKEAVDMAELFVRRLEALYGRELFSEAVHANILRIFGRAPKRVIGMDPVCV